MMHGSENLTIRESEEGHTLLSPNLAGSNLAGQRCSDDRIVVALVNGEDETGQIQTKCQIIEHQI